MTGIDEPMYPAAPDAAADDDGTVDAVAAEFSEMSRAIEELRERLDLASSKMEHVAVVRTSELEIGRLFVQAQEFTDAALGQAEQRARQAIAEAEAEATRILEEARREAEAIVEEARQQAALPPEAVGRLDSTIAGFIEINRELIEELVYLRGSYNPAGGALGAGAAQALPTAGDVSPWDEAAEPGYAEPGNSEGESVKGNGWYAHQG